MRAKILSLLIIAGLCSPVFAQPVFPPLNIRETDGTPSAYPYQLKVTNGALTDNGDGTVSLSTTGAGLAAESIDTSAELADLIQDENGTGVITFSTDATMTGLIVDTITATGLIASISIQDTGLMGCDSVDTDAGGTFICGTDASGSSEIHQVLDIHSAKLPSANPMGIDAGELVWRGLFDASTDEHAIWQFELDDDYGSGTLYADVFYTMAVATSGNLVMTGIITAITSGDIVELTGAEYLFDSTNSVTSAVPGTAGNPKKATITLTNADSAAAGDFIIFQLGRDISEDTASGDAEILSVLIRE